MPNSLNQQHQDKSQHQNLENKLTTVISIELASNRSTQPRLRNLYSKRENASQNSTQVATTEPSSTSSSIRLRHRSSRSSRTSNTHSSANQLLCPPSLCPVSRKHNLLRSLRPTLHYATHRHLGERIRRRGHSLRLPAHAITHHWWRKALHRSAESEGLGEPDCGVWGDTAC